MAIVLKKNINSSYKSLDKNLPICSPVITERYVFDGDYLQNTGVTSNTGISSYVCEFICKNQLNSISDYSRYRWARLLVDQIRKESFNMNGYSFWRWEAKPNRKDYIYPPDWDDICKAIDAIKSYEFISNNKTRLKLLSKDVFQSMIFRSVFHKKNVGENITFGCKNTLALMMFIADKDVKPNNTEDIMVTAVALRTLLSHYSKGSEPLNDLIKKLAKRLVEVAHVGLQRNVPFCWISRCYFSWGLFLNTVLDVSKYYSELFEESLVAVQYYLENQKWKDLLPPKVANNLIFDELNFRYILLSKFSKYSDEIIKYDKDTVDNPYEFPRTPILYQHRRLKHFYGSRIWSLVIHFYVTDLQNNLRIGHD